MASRRKPSSPGSLLRRSCMSRALASRARFRTPNCCSSSSSNTGTPHRSRAVYRSDAPGALTVTWVDPVTEIILQSLLAAINVVHRSLSHLLRITAGVLHVLLTELADHGLVSLMSTAVHRANGAAMARFRAALRGRNPLKTLGIGEAHGGSFDEKGDPCHRGSPHVGNGCS